MCLLSHECDGVDSLEHYAECVFHWRVFGDKVRKPSYPRCLTRFLGLLTESIDDRIFHAVHMYAVMSAYNSRKHSHMISDENAIEALIWEGHRTAQLYHKGLAKRYQDIWTH